MIFLKKEKKIILFRRGAKWVLLTIISLFFSTLIFSGAAFSEPTQTSPYLAFFNEEVLTVTSERDGILPGTLRTALIQASGIRTQSSFTLVKIVFAPQVKRIQISKGPLPELDGSLTTIDCQNAQGGILIEWVGAEDNAGEDPSNEGAGFKITSNGNTIKGCHVTGFPGPGILILGNRNTLEQNIIGFHPEIPESQIPDSSIYELPKTNQGAGILLGKGASENLILHNDIIANTYHGVLFEAGVGQGNQVLYNFFAKNSGQPIKVEAGANATATPAINKIVRIGDTYLIEGTTSPRADLQIYLIGKDKKEIGMLVTESDHHKTDKFIIATKSKGFVENETELIALAQGISQNTSEFSAPYLLVPNPAPEPPEKEPTVDNENSPKENISGEGTENKVTQETEDTESDPKSSDPSPESASDAKGDQTGKQLGDSEPETIIDIQGQGDGGGTPDSGPDSAKQGVSSMGM